MGTSPRAPRRGAGGGLLALLVLAAGAAAAGAETVLELGMLYRLTDDRAGGEQLDSGWIGVALSGLLAVDHFNNRNPNIVPAFGELGDCDVVMHEAMYDTASTSIGAVEGYRQGETTWHAAVGPARSASSSPVAILGGIDAIPTVSYWSTSPDLDDAALYPYFLRTIPSDEAIAEALVEYFVEEGMEEVQILHVNDPYGSAYAQGLLLQGQDRGVSVTTFEFSDSGTDIENVVEIMAKTDLRISVIVAFESHFESIIKAAEANGLISDTSLFIWTDSVSVSILEGGLAPRGWLRILSLGAVGERSSILFDAMAAVNNSRLESFYERMPEGLIYPTPLFTDDDYVDDISTYSFDAVAAVGLAACELRAQGKNASGADLYNAIAAQRFEGTSGTIAFDMYGSRDFTTGGYVMQNTVLGDDGEVDVVAVGRWDNDNSRWAYAQPIVYADGSTNSPSYVEPVSEDFNHIGWSLRAVGITTYCLNMLLAITLIVVVLVHKAAPVFRKSQPFFLIVILVGSVISTQSILLFSVLDDKGYERDQESETVYRVPGLDWACQSLPYTLNLGFTLSLGGLLAKVERINILFDGKLDGQARVVRVIDMLPMLGAMIAVELCVLLAWQFTDPLRFERKVIDRNSRDQDEESIGRCVSAYFEEFFFTFLAIYLVLSIGAVYLAYQVRNAPHAFQENKYVLAVLMSRLQISALSLPLLFLLADNRSAYFVSVMVVALFDLAQMVTLFFPKIRVLMKDAVSGRKSTELVSI